MRATPLAGVVIDPQKRPFVMVDPRAGHGPGIGGFKADSELGVAMRAGHPCYFVGFTPDPMSGQTIEDIVRAEAIFLEKGIIQNAIDLVTALDFEIPRVAILAAVETVNLKIPSTLETVALCKMADRHQITGGILDGPLALNNAIDLEAAQIKGIDSPVAGFADILVVSDLEAGNLLAKSLTFMADADAAGIVIGARVPIILTSRADSVKARLASCAVAALVVQARCEHANKAVV